ncbi:MAG: hypothetical protein U1F43_26275 [Myxococcota bacterium]
MYPTVHRTARVYSVYGAGDSHVIHQLANGKPLYDKAKPYDIAIDWGYHRPAFIFIQCHADIAVVRRIHARRHAAGPATRPVAPAVPPVRQGS